MAMFITIVVTGRTTGHRAAIPADPALQDFGPGDHRGGWSVGATVTGVVWMKIHRVMAINQL